MDPFGNTYPSNGFKSRGSSYSHSSDGGLKGLAGTVTGVAKDVGAQLSSRGRSWSHIGGYLGAANTIYGGLVVVWALIALLQHGAFALGLGLGACMRRPDSFCRSRCPPARCARLDATPYRVTLTSA